MFFASKKEMMRYIALKDMEEKGEITNLKTQFKVSCDVNGIHICNYFGDFFYRDKDGTAHLEDVKGFKTPVYRLKKKLVMACQKVKIEEV